MKSLVLRPIALEVEEASVSTLPVPIDAVVAVVSAELAAAAVLAAANPVPNDEEVEKLGGLIAICVPPLSSDVKGRSAGERIARQRPVCSDQLRTGHGCGFR